VAAEHKPAAVAAGETVVGLHPVRALLRYDPAQVEVLHVERGRRDGRMQRLLDEARRAGVRVVLAERRALDALAGEVVHQGVVAECREAAAALGLDELLEHLRGLAHAPLLLVLDQVQDPHNLGACLRSADAVGADGVVAPRDRAVGLTPVVHKVASGAVGHVPFFQVSNLARALRALQDEGLSVVGCSDAADHEVYDEDLRGPLALVLGAEGSGLRRLTREHCDRLVAIPMLGRVESLNVSVAAGVVLFEALRQRRADAGSGSR
jgi:23S rRNA (guanosine2251-2'-O)-methyltransferase